MTRRVRFFRRTDRQIKIGHPAKSGQAGNPEKVPDAEILWVKEIEKWVNSSKLQK